MQNYELIISKTLYCFYKICGKRYIKGKIIPMFIYLKYIIYEIKK